MAQTPLQKAITTAQNAFFKTEQGKALVANTVSQYLTPEQLTSQVQQQLVSPTDIQTTFLQTLSQTSQKILDSLTGAETPTYVSGGTVAAATAPNYLLYAIIAVIVIVVIKKGKVL